MVVRGFSCFSGGFSFYSFQIAHLARPLPPNRRCRLNGRHTQAKAVMVKLWMLCRLSPHVAGVCPSYTPNITYALDMNCLHSFQFLLRVMFNF